LIAVVPRGAGPAQAIAALDSSRVVLPERSVRWSWVDATVLALDLEAFLAEASRRIRAATNRVLVRMWNFWSDDYVLTTLHMEDLPTLEALALRAGVSGEGLRLLGAERPEPPGC
jgi:hypothetical protein